MTEDANQPEVQDDLYEDKIQTIAEITDQQLRIFSDYAQKHPEFALSVTLDVHGSVITGELIGRNEWFDEVERRHAEQLGTIPEAMGMLGKREPDDESVDEFVHLRDARRITGAGDRPVDLESSGFMWRGKINAIDGWNIGYLARSYDE